MTRRDRDSVEEVGHLLAIIEDFSEGKASAEFDRENVYRAATAAQSILAKLLNETKGTHEPNRRRRRRN